MSTQEMSPLRTSPGGGTPLRLTTRQLSWVIGLKEQVSAVPIVLLGLLQVIHLGLVVRPAQEFSISNLVCVNTCDKIRRLCNVDSPVFFFIWHYLLCLRRMLSFSMRVSTTPPLPAPLKKNTHRGCKSKYLYSVQLDVYHIIFFCLAMAEVSVRTNWATSSSRLWRKTFLRWGTQ